MGHIRLSQSIDTIAHSVAAQLSEHANSEQLLMRHFETLSLQMTRLLDSNGNGNNVGDPTPTTEGICPATSTSNHLSMLTLTKFGSPDCRRISLLFVHWRSGLNSITAVAKLVHVGAMRNITLGPRDQLEVLLAHSRFPGPHLISIKMFVIMAVAVLDRKESLTLNTHFPNGS